MEAKVALILCVVALGGLGICAPSSPLRVVPHVCIPAEVNEIILLMLRRFPRQLHTLHEGECLRDGQLDTR